ncbi:bifunctional diguanylate cyclase/phosphodiesterase [Cellvibrio sp. NN19]|uniref:putative bifunctional diguanylate cyclase/phosphodiesterase n=1 Tax=Cellvibrio chitinivorans TaxID=3102792 RepID=UPI002B405FC8|nr:bifunctional diguanylate cyclase/phosphodiesterase [Cellvibrio sp. NN19]
MSIVIPISGAIIGILISVFLYHVIVCFTQRDYSKHLVLSLISLLYSVFVGCRIYEFQAADLAVFIPVYKLGVASALIAILLLLWFVLRRVMHPLGWFFWLLASFLLALLVANTLLPYGLQYQSISGFKSVHFPWGETLVGVDAEVGAWIVVCAVWIALTVGWATLLMWIAWWKTRFWLDAMVAVTLLIYFILSMQGMAARLGLIDALPLGAVGLPLALSAISLLYIYQNRRERLDYAQHLEWLTAHDEKTGLPNRSHLLRKLAELPPMMLAMIGLDNLGRINEAFGHEQGDQVIKSIGQRLLGFLQSDEIGVRFEGDHFVFVTTQQERMMALHRLIQEPVDLGQGLVVEISAGMGYLPTALVRVPTKVLQQAQSALIQAKSRGRGQVVRFDETFMEQGRRRQYLVGRMSQALAQGEFQLVYQPRVALNSHHMGDSFEALIRWNAPDGFVSPGEFIPMAEESGFVNPLGDWILQQALQQIKTWVDDGLPLGRVAVNISMNQLARVDFVDSVLAQLQASGVNPAQLELEVTESAAMENLDFVLASLQRLASAGITLAMDDFGTGYSSLSYLQKLPFHIIKIDMSFVRRLGTPEGDELVHGMMTLIRNLKRDMVAEGIETLEQLEWLRAQGCTEGQGYYLSKPLSVVDATAWLASHR